MDEDIWGDDGDDNKQNTGVTVVEDSNPFSNPTDEEEPPAEYTTLHSGVSVDLKDDEPPLTVKLLSNVSVDLTASYAQSTKSDTGDAVRIVNIEERKAKISKMKYHVYIIESGNDSVARRFNDFKWLYTALGTEFLFSIPSLPPATSIKRYKNEVVAQRRYDLERFLNRIHENELLRNSSATMSFLRQNDEQLFEDQKKAHKKASQERTEHDALCLLLKCYPNLETVSIPQHLLGALDEDSDHDLTYLVTAQSMPRAREFFMRCDERLTAINKAAATLFKTFAAISDELNVLNVSLGDLYDAESMDRPQCMAPCSQRFDVRQFQEQWRQNTYLQSNSFYKYFLLRLRYEHEDIHSVLDSFKRYDSVHDKFKKNKAALKKLKEKSPEKDASVLERELAETEHLLLVLCKVILLEQTPRSWDHRIRHYNEAVRTYARSITQTPM